MTTAKFRPSRASLLKRKIYSIDEEIVYSLIKKVAKVCSVPPTVLTKKGRYREHVLARNMCFYILHVHYKQTSAQIAPFFNRDRTTVLHGINMFVDDIEVIPYYMEKYQNVRQNIKIPKLYSDK